MLRTIKITLTPQQKLQLEQMHDSTRDGRVRDRIKAVLLASALFPYSIHSVF